MEYYSAMKSMNYLYIDVSTKIDVKEFMLTKKQKSIPKSTLLYCSIYIMFLKGQIIEMENILVVVTG